MTRDERMKALFESVGIKGELGRTARRYLRSTPEYAAARAEGQARAWLATESNAMADDLYELMVNRTYGVEV